MEEQDWNQAVTAATREGMMQQSLVTLTSGAFLIAFALLLGASNLVIGLLAAIPALAQLMQIPAVSLVEWYRERRRICRTALGFLRSFWLIVAALPFLASPETGIILLIVIRSVQSLAGAVYDCSWNSWMRDLVPADKLGTFFARRSRAAQATGLLVLLAAGVFIDYWATTYPHLEVFGYSILFTVGFALGVTGLHFLGHIPEPVMRKRPAGRSSFLDILRGPLQDINFRRLVIFLAAWNVAVNLAAPFFIVYMLRRLELGMGAVIAFLVISQVANILSIRAWGRIADRFNNKSVLQVSGLLFLTTLLLWTFTTLPTPHPFTLPLLAVIHVLLGASTGGTLLAAQNMSLKLADAEDATAYLASSSFVNAAAAGVAPLLGGLLADRFAARELVWTLSWQTPDTVLAVQTLSLQEIDFLFITSLLIGLYALHRLAFVEETGSVEKEVVVNAFLMEVNREIRDIAPIAGVRNVFNPTSLLKRRNGEN